MSIVVTGASGQLGRRTTEFLLDTIDPSQLVLATRAPEKLADVAERGAEVRQADFDDPTGLAAAFEGGQRMLLISVDSVSKLRQHRSAIEAAKTAGVTFVAYTSFVNPTEDNPATIAVEHRETERMLRESGMAWALLRHSSYAEMQVASAQAALARGSLVHNAGDGRVAYVSREDCAAVAATVVAGGDHDGRTYDVTGPQALGAADLATVYGELGGRNVMPVEVDDTELTVGMLQAGIPAEIAELLASFGVAARKGYIDTVSSTVQELTGHAPRTLRSILEVHRDDLVGAAGSVPA